MENKHFYPIHAIKPCVDETYSKKPLHQFKNKPRKHCNTATRLFCTALCDNNWPETKIEAINFETASASQLTLEKCTASVSKATFV